jgi:uncharacterized protein YoxC
MSTAKEDAILNETAVLIALVLLAVLVGAAVVALIQLRATLRSAQIFFDTTGKQLNTTLGELSVAMERINRVAKEIEEGTAKIKPFFDSLAQMGESISKTRDVIRKAVSIAGALLPAAMAGFWALFSRGRPSAETPGNAPESGPDDKEAP